MLLLSSADFFSKLTFAKNSFRNTIRLSNGLDPDQDRQNVGLDLGPNHLHGFTPDKKSCCYQRRVKFAAEDIFLLFASLRNQLRLDVLCELSVGIQLRSL